MPNVEINAVKISLKKIVRHPEMIGTIEGVVNNVHRIVIHTYQFLKLYFLQEEPPPMHNTLNRTFITVVMRVIIANNGGPVPSLQGTSQILFDR